MNCENCKVEIETTGLKFCSECGAKIIQKPVPVVEQTPQETPKETIDEFIARLKKAIVMVNLYYDVENKKYNDAFNVHAFLQKCGFENIPEHLKEHAPIIVSTTGNTTKTIHVITYDTLFRKYGKYMDKTYYYEQMILPYNNWLAFSRSLNYNNIKEIYLTNQIKHFIKNIDHLKESIPFNMK
jgi:DNA-directed RNA polymerase subunit RPC12/RpoP